MTALHNERGSGARQFMNDPGQSPIDFSYARYILCASLFRSERLHRRD